MRGKTPIRMSGRPVSPQRSIPSPIRPFDLSEETLLMVHEIGKMHKQVSELVASLERKHRTFDAITKGEMGPPGVPGRSVDHAAVVRDVMLGIRQPQDGKSPAVEAIAAALYPLVLSYVKGNLPKGETGAKGKDADPKVVAQAVLKLLGKGKGKLRIENIEGLENKIAEIRNHAALAGKQYGKDTWARGGGDTVVAGPGIAITNTVNGTKRISATGTAITVITITGTRDDSNVVFTAASEPTLLNINGAFYEKTGGAITWTYLTGTITLSSAVGTGGSIYGI